MEKVSSAVFPRGLALLLLLVIFFFFILCLYNDPPHRPSPPFNQLAPLYGKRRKSHRFPVIMDFQLHLPAIFSSKRRRLATSFRFHSHLQINNERLPRPCVCVCVCVMCVKMMMLAAFPPPPKLTKEHLSTKKETTYLT